VQFIVDKGASNASHRGSRYCSRDSLPVLFTVDEAAALLRTTRRAIYAMIERRQIAGAIRIRRRVLFRADDLLHWLDQKRAPSPEADLSTTQRYMHLSPAATEDAIRLLDRRQSGVDLAEKSGDILDTRETVDGSREEGKV
jgi:excisionase family DNA binding protein